MRIVLTILCGLVILFAGGCVVILASSAYSAEPVILGLLAVCGVNIAILFGVWGRPRPAFTIIMWFVALADFILAVALLFAINDPYVGGLAVVAAILMALKGLLTAWYAWTRRDTQIPAP